MRRAGVNRTSWGGSPSAAAGERGASHSIQGKGHVRRRRRAEWRSQSAFIRASAPLSLMRASMAKSRKVKRSTKHRLRSYTALRPGHVRHVERSRYLTRVFQSLQSTFQMSKSKVSTSPTAVGIPRGGHARGAQRRTGVSAGPPPPSIPTGPSPLPAPGVVSLVLALPAQPLSSSRSPPGALGKVVRSEWLARCMPPCQAVAAEG